VAQAPPATTILIRVLCFAVRRRRLLRGRPPDNTVQVRRAAVVSVSTETFQTEDPDTCEPRYVTTDVKVTASLAAAREPRRMLWDPYAQQFVLPNEKEEEDDEDDDDDEDEEPEEKDEEPKEPSVAEITPESPEPPPPPPPPPPPKEKIKTKKKKKRKRRSPPPHIQNVIYARPRRLTTA